LKEGEGTGAVPAIQNLRKSKRLQSLQENGFGGGFGHCGLGIAGLPDRLDEKNRPTE